MEPIDFVNINYRGERYALVSFYWNDDPDTICDDFIIIGENVIECSYEDNKSFFHVNNYEEFIHLCMPDNGEDFTILSVNNFEIDI